MATSNVNTDIEFTLQTSPKLLDFKNEQLKVFPRIEFTSSVLDFYAYSEILFNDDAGVIIDKVNFIEGVEFQTKCGVNDDNDTTYSGYLQNSYCWSENQMLDITLRDHISGTNIFVLISNEWMKDQIKSKAWKQKKIDTIVKDIATNIYEIPTKKQFVSATKGTNDFYQLNETSAAFIKRLADLAVGTTKDKSPFFTFLNSQGEFYFMSIEDLFAQPPIETIELKNSLTSSAEPNVINGYTFEVAGLPTNFWDYEKQVHYINSSGAYQTTDEDIKDYFTKGQKEKLLIRQAYKKVNDHVWTGIEEDASEQYIRQGIVNSLYKDSATPYRMEVVIRFNQKCIAGKTVKIKLDSSFEDKQTALEYSGKWLILKDHFMITNDGQAAQKLTLAKSGIRIDKDHPIKDFVT